MRLIIFSGLFMILGALGCQSDGTTKGSTARCLIDSTLSADLVLDKSLGYLVGSAVGDALGAPTEMWHRRDILPLYGYVDSLDPVLREASAEGPWKPDLPPGGTTDDTRWKLLLTRYLLEHQVTEPQLEAQGFARHILAEFEAHEARLRRMDSLPHDRYVLQEMKVHWLQEWAAVSKGYLSAEVESYSLAANRFYGGDLACGGLLYGPGLGVYFAGEPKLAYDNAYRLAFYDIGYARDITALSAALASALCRPQVNPDSALAEIYRYDPFHFGSARLLGRMAAGIYQDALTITAQARQYHPSPTESPDPPSGWTGSSLDYARQMKAYELMDHRLQQIPFHAGEIWMITLTGMLFTEFDFLHCLQFITNFGRDNDTAGAVAGAILGAYHGYQKIPLAFRETVEKTNAIQLDQPLVEPAELLADRIWARRLK